MVWFKICPVLLAGSAALLLAASLLSDVLFGVRGRARHR